MLLDHAIRDSVKILSYPNNVLDTPALSGVTFIVYPNLVFMNKQNLKSQVNKPNLGTFSWLT